MHILFTFGHGINCCGFLQVQIDMRKSTEKYQRACIARDRACELLKRIEQCQPDSTSADVFDPKTQEKLNRATEEVSIVR